jgi:hypothetical protein
VFGVQIILCFTVFYRSRPGDWGLDVWGMMLWSFSPPFFLLNAPFSSFGKKYVCQYVESIFFLWIYLLTFHALLIYIYNIAKFDQMILSWWGPLFIFFYLCVAAVSYEAIAGLLLILLSTCLDVESPFCFVVLMSQFLCWLTSFGKVYYLWSGWSLQTGFNRK